MKRSIDTERKTPADFALKSKREPLSTRVKVETRRVLTKAAKAAQTSLSDLSAAILDDYAEWLKDQESAK